MRIYLALGGVLLTALIASIAWRAGQDKEPAAPDRTQPPEQETVDAPGAWPLALDIVRIDPAGPAVLAGRARPEAEVSVSGNGTVLGVARADRVGQWTLIVDGPFEPGDLSLTLHAEDGSGGSRVAEKTVTIATP